MSSPAWILFLADGESQESPSKELGAHRAASKAGQTACWVRLSPSEESSGQAVCSFPPSPHTTGSCNLSHSYLKKCDLLPDGVEEKSN